MTIGEAGTEGRDLAGNAPDPGFRPGFRFSRTDGFVSAVGVAGATGLGFLDPRLAFVTAFGLAHFFLFCNGFRVSRGKELLWAGAFFGLGAATILTDRPGWPVTVAVALALKAVVVGVQLRSPSYHGVGWRRVNPGLPEWWRARVDDDR